MTTFRRLTINVGLNPNDGSIGSTIEPRKVLRQLRNSGYLPTRYTLKASATELTLVAELATAASCEHWREDIAKLAGDFKQDCIAVEDHTAGVTDLVGPGAAKWAPFNRDFFLTI